MNDRDSARVTRIATALDRAEEPVRLLRGVAWPQGVREAFLAAGGERLPEVEYEPFDAAPTLHAMDALRAELDPTDPVDAWFDRTAQDVGDAARLLAARATPAFLDHGARLFGLPTAPLQDENTTCLELARTFHATLDGLAHVDLGAPPPACHLAVSVAERLREAVQERLGEDAPMIEVAEELSANALAGPRRIRLRRTACFTDRDYDQLLQHEAWVHVITGLNGRTQDALPILGASHAGTTRTQEGLAVFAEFVSGAMDLDRLRRLADRVVAVQMSVDGADFVEVYRWFRARGAAEDQAFESTRRVFRGGVLTGGAPFTKDIVYLDGLLRVHSFLLSAVSLGRADCLRLLFVGKLDIEDLPAIAHLTEAGICRPPKHLPPWIEDLRYLIGQLAFTKFLAGIDHGRIDAHYAQLIAEAPRPSGPA